MTRCQICGRSTTSNLSIGFSMNTRPRRPATICGYCWSGANALDRKWIKRQLEQLAQAAATAAPSAEATANSEPESSTTEADSVTGAEALDESD